MAALDADRSGERQCHSARIAQKLDGRKVEGEVEIEPFIEQPAVRAADLVRERLAHVRICPAKDLLRLAPRALGEVDSGVEQRLGIGLHPRAVVAMCLRGDSTGAQLMAG